MNKQKLIKELHNTLSEMENDDENIKRLEKAMNFFSGTYDICEGYKHAILLTLDDQANNHITELEEGDLKKTLDILNEAI